MTYRYDTNDPSVMTIKDHIHHLIVSGMIDTQYISIWGVNINNEMKALYTNGYDFVVGTDALPKTCPKPIRGGGVLETLTVIMTYFCDIFTLPRYKMTKFAALER
jgi:hypothetical protein